MDTLAFIDNVTSSPQYSFDVHHDRVYRSGILLILDELVLLSCLVMAVDNRRNRKILSMERRFVHKNMQIS
jgi:hypothetical protein